MSGTDFYDDSGGLFKASALIRSVLHMDPDSLSDQEWSHQIKMAIWANNYQSAQIGKVLGG